MEQWLKRISKLINGESIRDISIEKVYEQLLKYHRELLQVFVPQSTLQPPRLIMFWPWPSAREIEAMPYKLTTAEAEELATFIHSNQTVGRAFNVPKYNAEFIDRGSLESQKTLDETLAEEVGHRIVRLPEGQVPLSVEVMETLNGPMPDFGKKIVANLKAHPPWSRMITKNELDPYQLSMDEFFPPLFVTHLTRQDYPVKPEEFTSGQLTEPLIEHLPLLAGKILVTQYHGDVKAIVNEHPQLTHVNGQQFWDRYCLPILSKGKI